jgi:Zn finger protein HypA/HybF involved in hydrogenase expression
MPIAPQPFKQVCPKCGYSKIVKPKSDVIDASWGFPICPKCKTQMDRLSIDGVDTIFSAIKDIVNIIKR